MFHDRKINCLLFLFFGILLPCRADLVENFEYQAIEDVTSVWKIKSQGFKKPIGIRLNQHESYDGRQSLELSIPQAPKDGARIILETSPNINPRFFRQLRFNIVIDHLTKPWRYSIYWADSSLFKNYLVKYGRIPAGESWQPVFASRKHFNREKGNLKWENGTCLRISIWIPGNQPAHRILIDAIELSVMEKSAPAKLNGEWWNRPGDQ